MVAATASKLLFGVAFLFASAHAAEITYPDSAVATRRTATVNVVWLDTYSRVNLICAWLVGADPTKSDIRGCYNPVTSTIYAVQPSNFNDKANLTILGHEFWHALGAEHPAY